MPPPNPMPKEMAMLPRPPIGKSVGAFAFAAVCLLIIISCGSGGEKEKASTMQQLVPEEIMGWKIEPGEEQYDTTTIFSYIDGAGEVYLSYGFQKVIVTRLAKENAPEITVEIFDMNKPEDAYGVFSYSRESEETGIGQGYEYSGSLLCFWKSQYFVCVQAERETPESKEAVFALARAIDAKIPAAGEIPKLVGFLPTQNLDTGGVRFLHDYSSLNYHYFLAEDNILNLGPDTRAVLGHYRPSGANMLCIQYPTPEQAETAMNNFYENYAPEAEETGATQIAEGKWVAVGIVNEYLVIVLDGPSENEARTLVDQCLQNIK